VADILVVGCRPNLVARVKESLETPQIHVAFTATLRDAYRDTSAYRPDFIVVDLEADLIEGFELVELLRGRKSASLRPILVYRTRPTQAGQLDEKLATQLPMLRTKLQRVFEISERLRPVSSDLRSYRDDRLEADFENAWFTVEGRRVNLSVREQELLRFLVERANRIVLREELIDGIWGYETRSLDVFVRRLRSLPTLSVEASS
jgi:DNA-binding response OmpR family regulator